MEGQTVLFADSTETGSMLVLGTSGASSGRLKRWWSAADTEQGASRQTVTEEATGRARELSELSYERFNELSHLLIPSENR